MTYTPRTPEGLRSLDHLEPADAVLRAWTEPGPHPEWHERTRAELHLAMPLLARALDRLEAEAGRPRQLPDPDRRQRYAIQVAILRTSHPELLRATLEPPQLLARPEAWEEDQRPTYQVVMHLEGPVD